MKRFLLALTICCISLISFAQDYLSFKGIPIQGPLSSFNQKLVRKGYKLLDSSYDSALFEGSFAGQNVSVLTSKAETNNNIDSVLVFTEKSDSWSDLESTYGYFKNLYAEKYGEPISHTETNPSAGESNYSLMDQLKEGKAKYLTMYELPAGTIMISIQYSDYRKGHVAIYYSDRKGSDANRQQYLEDI